MIKKQSISVSPGNAKLGAIPSVSLPAVTTCNPSAPCFSKCYARKIEKLRPTVGNAYIRNFEIWASDPAAYWLQVRAHASTSRFFRFHVSGDIPDILYLIDMVITAEQLPNTQFLAFTKQFHTVNQYLRDGYKIPENLKIIFSNWGDFKCENPYNLPVCEIIFKNAESVPESWKICGGNCTECACRGVGCWQIKNGETIAIHEH